MANQDPYETLGVARDASDDEIKRAYRTLARKYHPDVNTTPGAAERFAAVNAAYDSLSDPEKRAATDAERMQEAQPDWPGGFSFETADPGPFGDVFETFFGRSAAGPGAWAAADQEARLQISLEEAFTGAVRTVHLHRPEVSPEGNVRMRPGQVKIEIPPGIMPGQHLRVPGRGQEGDLYVEISFAPHPVYRVDGRDLFLDLPVAPWEAALGGRVVVPTPGGRVDLRIPANARAGQKLRLRGKGLPGHPPGDIFASLRIVNPEAKTDEARAVFADMARKMDFDPRAEMGG